MVELVREYPEIVADILEAYGISRLDVMDEVSRHYGRVSDPWGYEDAA